MKSAVHQEFMTACVECGMKATHQRLEIYRVLASMVDHPDAQTIYKQVKKSIPTISLDTVYRNLKLMSSNGLISIVGSTPENLRFDANMAHHHHFICKTCGLIRDFQAQSLESIPLPEEACLFGIGHTVHIEVRGICAACQKKKHKD